MFHRARRNRIADDGAVDMTPMLDIVFIMLIFFIVTSVFLDESGLSFANPPENPEPPSVETQSISIYVDAKDQVVVDQKLTELAAVSSRVEHLLAEKPEANIILRSHAAASLDPIVHIQDQMNLAGRNTVIQIDPPQ